MLSTEVKRENESLMIPNQSLVCLVKPDIIFRVQLAQRAYTVSYVSTTKISTKMFSCITPRFYQQKLPMTLNS